MQTARRLVKGPDTAETSKKHFAFPLWEDEGCTLPSESPKTKFKIFKIDAVEICKQ